MPKALEILLRMIAILNGSYSKTLVIGTHEGFIEQNFITYKALLFHQLLVLDQILPMRWAWDMSITDVLVGNCANIELEDETSI